MKRPVAAGFLLRVPVGAGTGIAAGQPLPSVRVAGVSFDVEPLFEVSPAAAAAGLAGGPTWQWHVARPIDSVAGAHPWELAHALTASTAATGGSVLVEPDFVQEWPYENPSSRDAQAPGAAGACTFNDQRPEFPHVVGHFAWHLDDGYAQLRKARREVAAAASVAIRVAHLDTGFDPAHRASPAHVRSDLQRNFVDDQGSGDAHDPGPRGGIENPGHGTGTIGILAGGRFAYGTGGYSFDDEIGGAPEAEIVPIRVGRSVVQLLTSNIAKGIQYAAGLCANEHTRIHVLSMSMGGVASAAWADAVNMAYDAGIVFVAAAGNNFSAGFFGVPTHFIVYPARFRRVIAACGVMASRTPYYGLPFGRMQGSWGPSSKMATAVSAWTPNVAWPELGCPGIVDMDGSGTSAATPQVAATAALYLQRHAATLFDRGRYPDLWMRVEAVRQALFAKADKTADGGSAEKLGNGILRAADALALAPPAREHLVETARDSAVFPLLRVLTGVGIAPGPDAMLALEATQLAHRWTAEDRPNPIESATTDPDLPLDAVPPSHIRRMLEALVEHPDASPMLKARAAEVRATLFGTTPTVPRTRGPVRGAATQAEAGRRAAEAAARPFAGTVTPFRPAVPTWRALRGYSIDPSLRERFESAPISETVFKVPWERLAPGPVGEYLEVIDVDPASGCFYEPVNLDDPVLLAQDGLAPSEGTPQFHQQMAYAVASLTISHFERALGRKSLWRPGPPPEGADPRNDSHFVQRLRVYPHALREANAYYSPAKVALLFGYFNASADDPADHVPGGRVFTCLSHDIIAHETTHALLDGMHRRFLNPTNPDVRAFHEAFGDIVALFQHFTFPDVLRHAIAGTRGDIRRQESVLGRLATQFGRATGLRGALRDAIGGPDPSGRWTPREPDPALYESALEPHERGGLLVAAVFDAFLAIYERRTADLVRLATGGSGVLEAGALHPDLVGRLAAEAAKAAQHVLTMCIRALDYAPPVDITFGEFLRALITADVDAVPDDDLRYRVAFVEAFRRRGLYPRGLRTLSEDSLVWRGPHTDELRPSAALAGSLERVRVSAMQFLFAEAETETVGARERLFHLERGLRRELHDWLVRHVTTHPDGRADAAFMGIDADHPFEVHTARFALRPMPDGSVLPQFLMGILQDVDRPGTGGLPLVPFEGGCTIVADLRRLEIRYCVRKSVTSETRLERQRTFAATRLGSARATYFGLNDTEPFALLHRGLLE